MTVLLRVVFSLKKEKGYPRPNLKKKKMETISVGDVLIGLPSSGVHSNEFSLVRRVLDRNGISLKDVLLGNEIKSIPNISRWLSICHIFIKHFQISWQISSLLSTQFLIKQRRN